MLNARSLALLVFLTCSCAGWSRELQSLDRVVATVNAAELRATTPIEVVRKGRGNLSAKALDCVDSAAMYHSVNAHVLEAIVRNESRGDPKAIGRNTNGSVDVGLTGINSVHFPELAKKGVAPEDLFDECVAIYVGAWKLSKKLAKHGNTWKAIGAYHSETPEFNLRYQGRIYRELVSMGVVPAR